MKRIDQWSENSGHRHHQRSSDDWYCVCDAISYGETFVTLNMHISYRNTLPLEFSIIKFTYLTLFIAHSNYYILYYYYTHGCCRSQFGIFSTTVSDVCSHYRNHLSVCCGAVLIENVGLSIIFKLSWWTAPWTQWCRSNSWFLICVDFIPIFSVYLNPHPTITYSN